MERLEVGAEVAQKERQNKTYLWERVFWLASGVGGALTAYYLTMVRFPELVVQSTYTTLPDLYLSLTAVVLLAAFLYRYRALFLGRTLMGWAKGVAILLMMFALALGSAALVREVAYRLPGVRLLLNSEVYHTVMLDQLLRSMNKYCGSDGDTYSGRCPDDAMKLVMARMDGIEAEMGDRLVKSHLARFLFVEGLALMAMVAVFLGLHRLVMSGRLGQSQHHYIRLLNRYGVEP